MICVPKLPMRWEQSLSCLSEPACESSNRRNAISNGLDSLASPFDFNLKSDCCTEKVNHWRIGVNGLTTKTQTIRDVLGFREEQLLDSRILSQSMSLILSVSNFSLRMSSRLSVALCIAIFALAQVGSSQELSNHADLPNVILCMADDLGWGDTGFNGNKIVKTPHLDRMAREGVTFRRWYAGAPVCSPTRGNCLTGRHPLRLGIPTANAGHLQPAEQTLAERLKARGYATGHFGKWHLGTLTTFMRDSNRGRPGDATHFSPPWQNGFDVCFSTEAKVPTFDPMKQPIGKNLRYGWKPIQENEEHADFGTHYFDQTGTVVDDNLHGDDSRVIMDRVIPFVRSAVRDEKPFFMVVWFHAPHLPVVAGPKHSAMYSTLGWREQMYYGCITALDEQIGRLLSELETLGASENTMLWFCSDNGPENNTPGSAAHLRARKRSLHEGGIRVPGLLTWPRRIKTPRTVSVPCYTGDYYATVLATLGEDASAPQFRNPTTQNSGQLDGMNLMPIIDGDRSTRGDLIHFKFGKQAAVIGDRYKLYRANSDADWQLFDLENDESETNDLAADKNPIVKTMDASFRNWESSIRSE